MISFAREVADQVIFMDGGQIVASGEAAEMLDRPTNTRLRSFLARFHQASTRFSPPARQAGSK